MRKQLGQKMGRTRRRIKQTYRRLPSNWYGKKVVTKKTRYRNKQLTPELINPEDDRNETDESVSGKKNLLKSNLFLFFFVPAPVPFPPSFS